jgi:biopolymer transport protein ExbB/TolQ
MGEFAQLLTGGPVLAALALLIGASGAVLLQRGRVLRDQQRQARELQKLRRSLQTTQVQLDQARQNVEALQEEVQGWRRRAALGGQVKSAARAMPAPPQATEDWVLAALLDGDPRRGARESGFADTQVMLTTH